MVFAEQVLILLAHLPAEMICAPCQVSYLLFSTNSGVCTYLATAVPNIPRRRVTLCHNESHIQPINISSNNNNNDNTDDDDDNNNNNNNKNKNRSKKNKNNNTPEVIIIIIIKINIIIRYNAKYT